jgi:hypothetical protein
MSKNKTSARQVVERYHERYLEYETAFAKDPFNANDIQKELEKLATSNVDLDSDEFLNKMIPLVIEKPQKGADVNNAALKFSYYVDFYLLTEKDDLPENIMQDYEKLPIRDSIKTYYSIKDGNFVENEKLVVTEDMRVYFKTLIKEYKKMK